MHMRDWVLKLDDFLKLTGREVLTDAGKISHEEALEKAHAEYEQYRKKLANAPSLVEQHFLRVEKELGQAISKSAEK